MSPSVYQTSVGLYTSWNTRYRTEYIPWRITKYVCMLICITSYKTFQPHQTLMTGNHHDSYCYGLFLFETTIVPRVYLILTTRPWFADCLLKSYANKVWILCPGNNSLVFSSLYWYAYMNVMILQKLLWNKIYPTGITLLSYQLSEVLTSTACQTNTITITTQFFHETNPESWTERWYAIPII